MFSYRSVVGKHDRLKHAVRFPDRFQALGLFNMPYHRTKGMRRLGFKLQKTVLSFPRFYAKQAAKSLYSKEILNIHAELSKKMQDRLSERSALELSRIIDAVILNPEDAAKLIENMKKPHNLLLIGEKDYVGKPPRLETWTVPGGRVTPHESVEQIKDAITKILSMGPK